MWLLELIFGLMMIFLLIGAPLGFYFLDKYLIRQCRKYKPDFAAQVLSYLRFINIFFQPALVIFYVASTVLAKDIRDHFLGHIGTVEFCLFYFMWPLSCAIYKETKNSKWEWAIFWSSAVIIIPWIWLWFAFNAE